MTVFKRKGSPYYRYDFLFEGRRYQASTRLRNRIAAQRAEDILRAKLAERRAGIMEPKPVTLFKDFAARFLEMAEPEIGVSTHRCYSICVRNLMPWFGPKLLSEIAPDLIREYKESRLNDGRAGSTVNRDLACLRRILSVAMKDGLIDATPFSAHRVEFLEENGRERVLKFEEERAYLAVAVQPLRDVATVILETGLRPGELFCLRREDVHLKVASPYVHVPAGNRDRSCGSKAASG